MSVLVLFSDSILPDFKTKPRVSDSGWCCSAKTGLECAEIEKIDTQQC